MPLTYAAGSLTSISILFDLDVGAGDCNTWTRKGPLFALTCLT